MANYLFDDMTQAQSSVYDSDSDALFFLNGSASSLQVTYAPANGLLSESVTLNDGAKSLIFSADGLGGSDLTFFNTAGDDSTLAFGSNTLGENVTVEGTEGSTARYFGLGGNDTIYGSDASDTIDGGTGDDQIRGYNDGSADALASKSDYLFGGAGSDSVYGSDGNDHIYGNTSTTVAGTVDGGDTIYAAGGNDYVNGNAGDDSINGGDGNDRLYGGAGDDSIFGSEGNDYLQGNKGADYLDGGAGVDQLHGGADNDYVYGGDDNDLLFGDNGADTLEGGAGYDQLTGGAGADTFRFFSGDANADNVQTVAGSGVTDQILDYVDGTDKISTNVTFTTVLHGDEDVTVGSVSSAYTYAQSLITADLAVPANAGHIDVAAVTVGSDTYLFYSDAGTADINSVIKVAGVADTVFTTGDFTSLAI